MGTEYLVARHTTPTIVKQFSVDEHSNLFDLSMFTYGGLEEPTIIEITDLSPEQLIQAACVMLKVASYWGTSDKEIQKAVSEALEGRTETVETGKEG